MNLTSHFMYKQCDDILGKHTITIKDAVRKHHHHPCVSYSLSLCKQRPEDEREFKDSFKKIFRNKWNVQSSKLYRMFLNHKIPYQLRCVLKQVEIFQTFCRRRTIQQYLL